MWGWREILHVTKKAYKHPCKPLIFLVGASGFEPPAL